MLNQPLISIITINYNQSKVTCDLLASLQKITYKNIEVIVVDNASPSDNPQVIKKQYPEILFIPSDENLGFAGGNNLAIKQAKGKHLLFINNDVEVASNFLEPLVQCLEENPTIGMVSPKIHYYNHPKTIQYAGCTPINPYTTRGAFIGHKEKDEGQYDQGMITNYAHGAAMLVCKEAIDRAGMMPELYFLYYEELDWCNRIKEHGYEIYYEPQSLVFHKESISVGKQSTLKTFYQTRNRLIYIRRNIKGYLYFISILYFIFLTFPKNTIQYIVQQKIDLLYAFIKGAFWNITHLGSLKN